MTWKLGMAVVGGATPAQVSDALKLQPSCGDVRPELPLGDAIEYRATHWGVGTLGNFTIVTGPVGFAQDARWTRLAEQSQAIVFNLDEGASNLLIYDWGKRVARREEKKGARAWTPTHSYEKRVSQKSKQDYIAGVFRNMTGTRLGDAMDTIVTTHVLPAAAQPKVDEVYAKLVARLAEPWPVLEGPLASFAALEWGSRWEAIHEALDVAWPVAPSVVAEQWIPMLVDHVKTWPASRRPLPWPAFDLLSRGMDDGRYGDYAPLYRQLALGKYGRDIPWKPKVMARFFSLPICRGFTSLSFEAVRWSRDVVELLVSSPMLATLDTLILRNQRELGNDEVARIVRAFPRLRALDLR